MKSWSCRKQGPRPNLPRRPNGPRPRRGLVDRLKRLATNLLCLVLFVAGGWAGRLAYHEGSPWLAELFTVREVRVTGLVQLTREEVLARAGLPADETLFTVSPARIAQALGAHPWIKSARVTRLPFHTVAVEIAERQPAAVVRAAGTALVVDAEGIVLAGMGESQEAALPVLVGIDPDRLRRGDAQAGEAVRVGMKLAGLLGERYQGRPEVDVGNPTNAVGYVQGLRFEFGAASFEEKWARYHKIEHVVRAKASEAGAEMRGEIDLRYPGKVIVRERG